MRRLAIILTLLTLLSGGIVAQAQSDPPNATIDTQLTTFIQQVFATVSRIEAALLPCGELPRANLSIHSTSGAITDGAIYCREITRNGHYQINPGAIGNQGVIARGVQQAYDLFGLTITGDPVTIFDHAVSVCLRGRGELVFLPVFASPRPALKPQSFTSGAFTCARLGSAGTLALVNQP